MERYYWTNPDVFEREVNVKAIGEHQVLIAPNLFHPNEGGQPADRGTIGPARVLQVNLVEGKLIHTLDQELTEGVYLARLDRKHREHTAAQHTAQHIISGIAERQWNLQTKGVHIGADNCTVDFDKQIDWERAQQLERLALDVVLMNLPVETVFDEEDVRIRSDFKEIQADTLRVVKIADIDKSACCGAHVASTGQVGVIRITDLENRKDGTRLSFLAGRKALEFSQTETAVLRALRKSVRCATGDLPEMIQKNLDQLTHLNRQINHLWTARLPELVETAAVIEINQSKIGIQVVDLPQKLIGKLAGMIAASLEGAAIVVSDINIAIFSNTVDAMALFNKIQNIAGGKGGGAKQAANGKLDKTITTDQIKQILTE